MLIATTAVCLVSGLFLNQLIRQRTAVRRFYELTSHRPDAHGEHLVTMGYRYQGKDEYYKPIIPKWQYPLRVLFGEEALGEVTGVQLLDTAASDEDLRYVAYFPAIERVSLSRTNVTDKGLLCLQTCSQLRSLHLDGTAITDIGVARLAAFGELESLSLSGTKITDAGLIHLAKLPKLKELWLRDTQITDAGHRSLRDALPDCQIQADVPTYFQKQQPLRW
jgi:hypothetical protein